MVMAIISNFCKLLFGGYLMKRILTAALALILVLSLVPAWTVKAEAAATPELQSLVRQQIQAYAASIHQVNSHENAALQMADYAITRKGKAVHVDDTHVITACMYSSGLMQDMLTYSCSNLIDMMQKLDMGSLCGIGGMNWRSYGDSYSLSAYLSNQKIASEYVGSVVTSKSVYGDGGYAGALNDYDDTMLWVVGSSYVDITMTRSKVTADTITYKVDVLVKDQFDYDINYDKQGSSAAFEIMVAVLGTFMGKLLFQEYDWTSTSSFRLEVPNTCDHTTGSYHWTYDKEAALLTSDGSGGYINNGTTRYSTTSNKGVTTYYHELDKTVRLMHDQPWVVEYSVRKPGTFALSPMETYVSREPCLLNYSTSHFYAVNRERVELTEEEQQAGGFKSKIQNYTHYYGTPLKDFFKYSSKQIYTFHLENEIAADGSNMVYLTVYNNDLQETVLDHVPLDDYYLTVPGGKTRDLQNTADNWVSGKDFRINYIGNKTYRLNPDYFEIYIWENGRDTENRTSFVTSVQEPTCAQEGYTSHTCAHCGYSYKTDTSAAQSHSYGDWYQYAASTCTKAGEERRDCSGCGAYETRSSALAEHTYFENTTLPTCTKEGYTTYTCIACGDSYRGDPVAATGHKPVVDAAVAATCTTDGLTEGSHCGECGVTLTAQMLLLAQGHRYNAEVVSATCTTDGYTVFTCGVCADSYTDEKMEAWGHTPGSAVKENKKENGAYDLVTRCIVCTEVLSSEHVEGTLPVTGDVDGSGTVDVDDAIYLLFHVLFGEGYEVNQSCDFDGTGEVDVDDAIYLLFHVLVGDGYPLG